MMNTHRYPPSRVAVQVTAVILMSSMIWPVMLSATAGPAAEESLQQVWTGLVGKRGILEEKSCGYVLTLSSPTQSGNAVVRSVHGDHVVLVVDRDQTKLEYVVPLAQITLRRSQHPD